MRSVHGCLVALLLLASCRVQPLLRSGDARSIDELRAGDTLHAQPIRTDDKLTISVWNHDELSVGSVFTIYNTNESFGKWLLVDAHGEVPVPGVGIMKLGGLTCEQAQDTLRQRYAAQLRDPVVVVKVLNRQVTILGEVRTPGSFVLDKERTTLTELFGMAQGFTDVADKRRVNIVRNDTAYVVDLTRLDERRVSSIIVRSGDVVTVPARNYKAVSQRAPIIIPFASAITAIALILSVAGR